jgi:methyltransferase family protein
VITLREVFAMHTGRLIDKWSHYFPIYEHHFAKFVGRPIRLLEIGVGHGGSLQMWKRYFGPKAEIHGFDIDPRCEEYEEEQINIWIGDQSIIGPLWGGLDIVIDDGSHLREDQVSSFKDLWPCVVPGGIYLIEDCHGMPPTLTGDVPLIYRYPWVIVAEKPKRMVIGTPSRALNDAEVAAYGPQLVLQPIDQPLATEMRQRMVPSG